MKSLYIGMVSMLFSSLTFASEPNSIIWRDLVNTESTASSVFEKTNPDLDGKQVVIPGFVIVNNVANELGEGHSVEAGTLNPDLPVITVLSPQRDICFHTPPPPANQLIQLKMDPGVNVEDSKGKPVYLVGTLKVEKHLSGLFSTAYTLQVSETLPYPTQ